EGVLTVIVGAVGAFTIADCPEKASKRSGLSLRFLSEKEAAFVVARIEQDRHNAIPEAFNIGIYMRNAGDLKVWGFAALFGLTTTVTYAIAYFFPITLRKGMGFDVAEAQFLIAPSYCFAAIWKSGDKYLTRGPLVIINAIMDVVCLCLLGLVENVGVRYFGVFLATTSANVNVPYILTSPADNFRRPSQRTSAAGGLT
ncbi:hypothetical protein LTS12_027265, partial [Elasticomyces elasticus]